MPFFCLISLFYVNLSFSTCPFLIFANMLSYFPVFKTNLKNLPLTPYCPPSTSLFLCSSSQLNFLRVWSPGAISTSHSHVNHFTSVSPLPTTLKITSDTHHVKCNGGSSSCFISLNLTAVFAYKCPHVPLGNVFLTCVI